MSNYKKLDAWKYILLISENKDTSKLKEDIRNRYSGTSVECDFMEYEMEQLAKEILLSDEVDNPIEFIRTQNKEVVNAIYDTGLDHYLFRLYIWEA